jgi:hypothetical protein
MEVRPREQSVKHWRRTRSCTLHDLEEHRRRRTFIRSVHLDHHYEPPLNDYGSTPEVLR